MICILTIVKCVLSAHPQDSSTPLVIRTECQYSKGCSCSGSTAPSHVVVQSPSRVRLWVTPWTAAHQASPSFTASRSLLNLMSVESRCHPPVLPSVVPFSSCPQFREAGQSGVCTDMLDQNVDSCEG